MVTISRGGDSDTNTAPYTGFDGFVDVFCDTPYNFTANDLIGNDTDFDDSDTLSFAGIVLQPQKDDGSSAGKIVINADGSLTYVPAEGFVGTASFHYRVEDGNGGWAVGLAQFYVQPIDKGNVPPEAVKDYAEICPPEESSVTIDVLANDSDADGDDLTISAVGEAANGTVTLNADGTITYTPNDGFVGEDTFTYTIVDGRGGTSTAEVCITVKEPKAETGSIGDRVWLDLDEDGLQDENENGVAGVTVQLKDANGEVLDTTRTDANGNYLFDGLEAGTYQIGVVAPDGFRFTQDDVGRDDNIDSDVNITTGMTGDIVLGAGEDITNVDAGLIEEVNPNTAEIRGQVFCDEDDNDVFNTGDSLVEGVRVYLLDENGNRIPGRETATNGDGAYAFTGLAAGTYFVEFEEADFGGKELVAQNVGDEDADSDADPDTGRTEAINLTEGEIRENIDAGIEEVPTGGTASLAGRVFCDTDNDDTETNLEGGIEEGVSGVTVWLTDTAGNRITDARTDADGNYEFTGLVAGRYQVEIDPDTTDGKVLVRPNRGGDDTLDSDFNRSNSRTGTIVLEEGARVTDVDAGVEETGSGQIRGLVFCDEDDDSIRDNGEPRVAGVTVTLLNADGQAIRQTETNQNGAYAFTGLADGEYRVAFDSDDFGDKILVDKDQGSNERRDSDANQDTGITDPITIEGGNRVRNVDAGIEEVPPSANSSVGDRVWLDENGNGVQDDGEEGIAGVTVQLKDENGEVLDTTRTDANGNYLFDDLQAGDYQIGVVAPDGFGFTTQDEGGDDTADSDINAATGMTDTFSLGEDEDRRDIDAGLIDNRDPETGLIRGQVFCDENDNDIRDTGDSLVEGITVYLLDENGVRIPGAVTTTNANGAYAFTGLAAGTYAVEFEETDFGGKTLVAQNVGNERTDSDADPDTGRTDVIILTEGEIVKNIDAGIEEVPAGDAAIGDRVWHDANRNGLQDEGEEGIGGITVQLKDADGEILDTAETDADGNYLFDGLAAGTYAIGIEVPDEFMLTRQDAKAPGSGERSLTVDTTAQWQALGVRDNGANVKVGTGYNANLQGITFNQGSTDSSNSTSVEIPLGGAADVAEWMSVDLTVFKNWSTAYNGDGSARARFELVDEDGNVLDTVNWVSMDGTANIYNDSVTTNDENIRLEGTGKGLFVRVTDQGAQTTWGDDFVIDALRVTARAESEESDEIDSDINPDTLMSENVTLQDGEQNLTIDAGLFKTGTAELGDRVWFDTNENGRQDSGERGASDVVVQLKNADGVVIDSTETDANGNYLFDELPAGTYSVAVVPPEGFIFTQRNAGSNDALDSDILPNTGMSDEVTLRDGESNLTVDAGLIEASKEICAELVGSTSINEGSTSTYKVQLDHAVREDTWFTIQVSNGSAQRVDRNDFEANNQDIIWDGFYTQFINRPHLSRIYDRVPNGHAFEGPRNDRAAVGPDGRPTWDYTVLQDGVVQSGGLVHVLVRAGETMSEDFQIKAFRERITVDVSDNPSSSGFERGQRAESNETLSIRITGTKDGSDRDDIEIKPGINVTIRDIDNTNVTPIAIDLNRDGEIGVTGETSSWEKDPDAELGRTVEFDIDADGDLDVIEWFDGSGDGILVDNRDGNAASDMDGARLFGDEGGRYANGYEKLAKLDENGDGQLTGEELAGLEFWVDDGDAIVEEGELQSLAEHGIVAISTEMEIQYDDQGRELMRSSATTEDGEQILSEDVWFAVDLEAGDELEADASVKESAFAPEQPVSCEIC